MRSIASREIPRKLCRCIGNMSARAGQPGGRTAREGEEPSQRWDKRAASLQRHNAEEERERTEGCGRQEILIKRITIPSFDGSQEGWVKFSRVFKELNKASKQGPILELDQLASKLRAEAKILIA